MPTDLVVFAIPLGGIIALLIAFVQLLRVLHAWIMHATLRRALSADHAVALGLVERLDGNARRDSSGDDRTGLVLVALGLAIAGFGLIQGGGDNIRIAFGAALFPLFVGGALLIRHHLLKRESGTETAVGE